MTGIYLLLITEILAKTKKLNTKVAGKYYDSTLVNLKGTNKRVQKNKEEKTRRCY